MAELTLTVTRQHFNLLWRSLHDRETALLARVEEFTDDSEEGAAALNDLAYLRLYRKQLKESAEPIFHENAFSTSDEFI